MGVAVTTADTSHESEAHSSHDPSLHAGAGRAAHTTTANTAPSWSGPLQGQDHSTAAAELAGATATIKAAAQAATAIDLYVDNLSVQRRTDDALQGKLKLPRFAFGAWAKLKHYADQLPPGSRCYWVPSHGKQTDWTAPSAHTTEEVRSLNDVADKAAAKHSHERWQAHCKADYEAQQANHDWSHRCLVRLAEAEQHYLTINLPDDDDAERRRRRLTGRCGRTAHSA